MYSLPGVAFFSQQSEGPDADPEVFGTTLPALQHINPDSEGDHSSDEDYSSSDDKKTINYQLDENTNSFYQEEEDFIAEKLDWQF